MSEASRIEESLDGADRQPTDLVVLVRALGQAYETSFPTHRFVVNVPGNECFINANGEMLAQALDKLVENAVSFTTEGKEIELQVAHSDKEAHIVISNPGPLLPDHLKARLFEPMVSVREHNREGAHLGIGLYVARAIVEAHDGRLSAENRPDNTGVVFRMRFDRT